MVTERWELDAADTIHSKDPAATPGQQSEQPFDPINIRRSHSVVAVFVVGTVPSVGIAQQRWQGPC